MQSPSPTPADDVLTTPAPAVSTAEAAAILHCHFGLQGEVTALTSERDRNFRLRLADGRAFVLKLAHPAEPAAVTNLQTAALLHLAARDPALPVPAVVPGLDGAPERRLTFGDGRAMVTRLITYLEGEPLHRATASPAQARALGLVLGRLDRALADFRHPAMERSLLWDATRVTAMRGLFDHLPDGAARDFIAGIVDRFEAVAMPCLGALRRQLTHNDLNPHNVVVDPADHQRIAGIIDFGDALAAPLVADLGTALAYQVAAEGDPLSRVRAFAAGFQSECPLDEGEIAVLPHLVMARMVLTICITHWRAGLEPGNRDYILRNNPGAWRGLRALAALAPEDLAADLGRAMRG